MSWRSCRLGDVLTLKRGHDLPEHSRQDGEVPVVSSSGITGYHKDAKATAPGVVTGRYGTLGEVFFLDRDYRPLNTALYVIDFKGNDPKFSAYFLKHALKDYQSNKAAVPGVDRNVLHELLVRAPNITTQLRIASILSTYDNLIENNRRRMALLEESARLLYREWFVRLRFPGHEHTRIIDGVPEGWERRTALDAIQILSGGTPKTTVTDHWDGEIPFYTPKDAVDGVWVTDTERSITERGLNNCNSKLYPRETVFISARGTVGKLNIAQRPMAMSQSCYALVAKSHLTQPFVFCAMQAAVDVLRQQAVGAVFDAIIVDTFKRIPLLVPSASIARLFDENIQLVFQQVENLTLQNQKLRAARDLLLPRLMSGEIAV
ncbi:MAG: restriction endonuclease subunit S [Candidatus Competibacteraceae bacterium]|nr:MAG: restriction endonuclease subunit S [Candidatus Competibacteraceae bacterium]